MEWLLEIVLIVLLAATLFHAVRLERALGVLKRDRAALEELVGGFNASTRQAEPGSSGCAPRPTAPGGRLPSRSRRRPALKDDLAFLPSAANASPTGWASRCAGPPARRAGVAARDEPEPPMTPAEPGRGCAARPSAICSRR